MSTETSEEKAEDRHSSHNSRTHQLHHIPEYQVTCIRQEPGEGGHYRISQLGVRLGNEVVILDVAEVVELVRMGKRFYVERGARNEPLERHAGIPHEKAYLETKVSEDGHPYVETHADKMLLDNLDALRECEGSRWEETVVVIPAVGVQSTPATNPTNGPASVPASVTPDGDEDRPGRRHWLWLIGAALLALIGGLGILLAIASSALLAQSTLLIIGIIALLLLGGWVLLFRNTWRTVYRHHFHRRRSGWAMLLGLLLFLILILVLFPPATPAIAFSPIPDHTFLDPDFQVSASESDHQPVYFTGSGDIFCTVTKDGIVHINSAGGCAITALSVSNSKVAGVSHTFGIGRKAQAITFNALSGKTYGDPDFALIASADSSLTIEFAASGPCTIAGSQVRILGAGDCTITAYQGGNLNYAAAKDVVQTFHIAPQAQTITFGPVGQQSLGAGALALDATASSKLPVSFTTADTTVCKSTGGAVALVAAGSCTVTAHQAGDANFSPAADVTQSFTVSAAAKQDQTITFGALSGVVFGGPNFGINASASSGLAVSFTTDGKCSVDGVIVKITGAGSCTVTAHQAGNNVYNAAADVSQSFAIAKATPRISWGLDEIVYGTPLDATFLNATAWDPSSPYTLVPGNFTYSPGAGTLLAVGEHSLHVVFTPADTADYNGPVSIDIILDVEPVPAPN